MRFRDGDARAAALLFSLCILRHIPPNYAENPGAPTIIEHPLDILVVKDDPVTLRCAANGENVEITWFKDGQRVNVGNGHRLMLPNGSLFLLKVISGGKDSDAGSYYCIAKNEHGEARSQEANVRIAMLRDEFRVRPRTVTAIIGNRATMECSPPRGFPEPVVTWKKDEKELNVQDDKRYSLHPTGNLVIENVQRSDAGFYQCVAVNMVGERVSNPAKLSVYEKPRFLAEPKDTTADANSSVLFDCRVAGEPTPTVSWKKRDDQMPVGRAYITTDSRGLRIDRVQVGDEGEYVCQAKNSAGSIEASARLKVNSPPAFSKTPHDQRVNVGRSAMFECAAVGQPPPGIFWSKEGDQHHAYFPGHVSVDGRLQVTSDGRLIIDDVRPSDHGDYVCAAVNTAGSTLAKAALRVNSNSSPSSPPPVIQYGHQNQTLMVNDMAILPCQSVGRTAVRITWLRNGQLLNLSDPSHDERYRQTGQGTLQISDLRKTDSGVYTCHAKNDDGEATWTASLLVEEHTNPHTSFQRMPDAAMFPSAPGKPTVLNVSDDAVELEWTSPERHGATPVNGYLLQYWSPELTETWENVPDAIPGVRFRVKHLKPGNSYVFIVRAENGIGIGPPSAISDLVTTKPPSAEAAKKEISDRVDLETVRYKLSSEQLIKLMEVRAINSTAMLLSWKRQRREPLVQGYYIKWRGPPLAPDHTWVNVSDADTQSVIINGLRPFTSYEFFVIPYHRSVQGMPSNSLDGTTHEGVPTLAPSSVKVRMLNLTTLRVSWRPPPPDGINGILKGFQIHIHNNASAGGYSRNITTNERAASVTLFNLVAGTAYQVHVAARTAAGVGIFYSSEIIMMNDVTLHEHLRLMNEANGSLFWSYLRRPLVVAVAGLIIWGILFALVILVICRWWRRRGNKSNGRNGPFIKINDGSVMYTARDAFWMDHQQFANGAAHTAAHETPHGSEYYGEAPSIPIACSNGACDGPYTGTMSRQSPHHYHYAQLPDPRTNNMASFYGRPEYQDDPSPYATTTLVMNSQTQPRRHWQPVAHGTLRGSGPVLPSNPVPAGPPEHFLSNTAAVATNTSHRYAGSCGTISGMPTAGGRKRAAAGMSHRESPIGNYHHSHSDLYSKNRQSRDSGTNGRCTGCGGPSSNGSLPHQSDGSPPQTDVSYIQSSDGTGGSGKASRTYGRRSPPKNVLDIVPPPPTDAPPADTETTGMYDAVSDCLLPQSSEQYEPPMRRSSRTPRHSRTRNARQRGSRDFDDVSPHELDREAEENERFLTHARHSDGSYDSEADGETSDCELNKQGSRRSQQIALDSPFGFRPIQPCMGINASAISQTSHDSSVAGNRRSTSRMKSLQRNGRKDVV